MLKQTCTDFFVVLNLRSFFANTETVFGGDTKKKKKGIKTLFFSNLARLCLCAHTDTLPHLVWLTAVFFNPVLPSFRCFSAPAHLIQMISSSPSPADDPSIWISCVGAARNRIEEHWSTVLYTLWLQIWLLSTDNFLLSCTLNLPLSLFS